MSDTLPESAWTIWKFDLPWADIAEVQIPQAARVLHVGIQPEGIGGQALKLWARVLTKSPVETRRFRVAGTGQPLQHPNHPDFKVGDYVGSVVFPDGSLAFHVFEEVGESQDTSEHQQSRKATHDRRDYKTYYRNASSEQKGNT